MRQAFSITVNASSHYANLTTGLLNINWGESTVGAQFSPTLLYMEYNDSP